MHKMKKLILLLLISQTVFIHQLFAQEAVESNADKGVRHEFVIANFRRAALFCHRHTLCMGRTGS